MPKKTIIYYVKEVYYHEGEVDSMIYCATKDKEKAISKFRECVSSFLNRDSVQEDIVANPYNYSIEHTENDYIWQFYYDNFYGDNCYFLDLCEITLE